MTRKKIIAISCGGVVAAVVAMLVFAANWQPDDYHTPAYNMRFKVPIYADMITQYREHKGRYPTTSEGLALLVEDHFIREIPRDDWGNEMLYRYPSQRADVPFELCSLGADGKLGGDGTNADICNWSKRK